MTKLISAVLFATLVACGGGGGKDPAQPELVAQPEPAPVEPAPVVEEKPPAPPPFELALGELTIYDGAEPGFKLHADGTTELGSKVTKTTGTGKKKKTTTTTEWKPGPVFKADGTVELEGKPMGKIGWDGVTDLGNGQVVLAYKVDGDALVVKGPTGEDVRLELVPEGIKIVGGPMDGRVDKIEATDDKVRRTALFILAVTAASSPSPAPAPEPATATPTK